MSSVNVTKSAVSSQSSAYYKFIGCNSVSERIVTPHLIFACSNSTIETLQKGVKYVQS